MTQCTKVITESVQEQSKQFHIRVPVHIYYWMDVQHTLLALELLCCTLELLYTKAKLFVQLGIKPRCITYTHTPWP